MKKKDREVLERLAAECARIADALEAAENNRRLFSYRATPAEGTASPVVPPITYTTW